MLALRYSMNNSYICTSNSARIGFVSIPCTLKWLEAESRSIAGWDSFFLPSRLVENVLTHIRTAIVVYFLVSRLSLFKLPYELSRCMIIFSVIYKKVIKLLLIIFYLACSNHLNVVEAIKSR